MNDLHIDHEELSAALDAALEPQRLDVVRAHVAACGVCSARQAELEEARELLSRLQPVRVPSEHVDSILAAVASQPLPLRRTAGAWSHLASSLAGAAAATLLFFLWPAEESASPRLAEVATVPAVEDVASAPPAPQVAWNTVYVYESVDVPREVRVEVPVPVEVPVEVRVETRVPTPLPEDVRLAFEGLAAAAELARSAWSPPQPTFDPRDLVQSEPAPPRAREYRPRRPAARVVVRAEGDRLGLETRGSYSEVMPGLIALLRDTDPDVVDLAHDRLVQVREALTADPEFGPRLLDPTRRSRENSSLGDLGEPVQDIQVEWERWWNANRDLVTASSSL